MGTKGGSSWKRKFFIILFVLIALGIGGLIGYYYIPFGDSSVKSGQLNYVMHKGIIFKTYEGKLIQTGIKSGASGGVQSNEFEFSIENKELAEKLMNMAGKEVKLHYKEYFGAVPWRGYTKYIVDSIISVDEPTAQETYSPALINQ
jgi:hypothetical protein